MNKIKKKWINPQIKTFNPKQDILHEHKNKIHMPFYNLNNRFKGHVICGFGLYILI